MIRISPRLAGALWVSALGFLISLGTLTWYVTALPSAPSHWAAGLSFGGLCWFVSLGYYALWQLDKR